MIHALHSLQQVEVSKVKNENRFLQTGNPTAVSRHDTQTCCHEEAVNETEIRMETFWQTTN